MKIWHQLALRYVLVWLVGTSAVLFVIPFARVSAVQNELDEADRLLAAGQPQAALAHLDRIVRQAALYPSLEQRHDCAAIRCRARVHDIPTAMQLAGEVRGGRGRDRRPSLSVWESLEVLPDALINSYLSHAGDPGKGSPSMGYETLLNELQQAGDTNEMVRIAKDILVRDPGNAMAKEIHDAVERKQQEDALATALLVHPRVETTHAAPPAPPVIIVTNHVQLAKDYLRAKQWNRAIEECDAALAADPAAPGVTSIKRLAVARDMKWGCTRRIAKAYDETGKAIRDLSAGTLLDIFGIKVSPSAGELAICRIVQKDAAASVLLIKMKDLDLQIGPLSGATEEEKSLRQRHGQLLCELDRIKDEAIKARMKNNPFAREYETALATYTAYWAKVSDLEARQKAATGDVRIKFTDALRQLKGEDIRVGQALERAKKKVDDWLEQNPPNLTADPQLEAVRGEINSLQSKLESLDRTP